jgi:hypothetical protein
VLEGRSSLAEPFAAEDFASKALVDTLDAGGESLRPARREAADQTGTLLIGLREKMP